LAKIVSPNFETTGDRSMFVLHYSYVRILKAIAGPV